MINYHGFQRLITSAQQKRCPVQIVWFPFNCLFGYLALFLYCGTTGQRWHCAGCVDESWIALQNFPFDPSFSFKLSQLLSPLIWKPFALNLLFGISAWWAGSGHSTRMSDWDSLDIQEDELTSTAAGYVRREPSAGEIGFPAPANTQRCLVFEGDTESSYKCIKFGSYMDLLSLLRLRVSNLLYQCKELLTCSNMFPENTRCLHRGGLRALCQGPSTPAS